MLVTAVEQEEVNIADSHWRILSYLTIFRATWFDIPLLVSQWRGWEVHRHSTVSIFVDVKGIEDISRSKFSLLWEAAICFLFTGTHSKFVLIITFHLHLCSVRQCELWRGKSVEINENSKGRKSAYLGFIFSESYKTCYSETPASLESIECMQVTASAKCVASKRFLHYELNCMVVKTPFMIFIHVMNKNHDTLNHSSLLVRAFLERIWITHLN